MDETTASQSHESKTRVNFSYHAYSLPVVEQTFKQLNPNNMQSIRNPQCKKIKKTCIKYLRAILDKRLTFIE